MKYRQKTKTKKTQISKIRNAKGEIAKNTTEILAIIRDYFDNLYSNKFENLEEMKFFRFPSIRLW
jgi:hypothetical protein